MEADTGWVGAGNCKESAVGAESGGALSQWTADGAGGVGFGTISVVYWSVIGMGVEGEVDVAAVPTVKFEGTCSAKGTVGVLGGTGVFVDCSGAHVNHAVAAEGFGGVGPT